MRILAIRGENLASLAEPFTLEFEQEPLRSAGLFAITGETGAGKSTILDALCLALYDKFPRVVAPGGAEGAPDPSGETLASGDPRAILRRGAGRGFAEADFIARDGLRYRARCDLVRARGKAAGKLQNRGRSLWRIDDDGEKIETLESGVEPVNRRIVELTDLTFDQFRRTALLAQGDFDAFLRADAKERADLLEKITGAEIYGRISKRAYERAAAAKQAVDSLDEKLKSIGVMADEDRGAALEESAALTERRVAFAAEREDSLAALRAIDARVQAKEKLAQAQAAQEAAAAALEGLAQERRTLVDLARAEPLRAPRAEMARAERALAEKQAEAAASSMKAQEAQLALDAAETQARAANEALAAIESEMAKLAPLWTQAGALDQRIETLAAEEATARTLAEAAAQLAIQKRDEYAGISKEQRQTEAAHQVAVQDSERLASARPLSERWDEIDEWLSKRAELTDAKASAEKDLARANEELTRATQSLAACDAADEKDRATRGSLEAQIEERGAALVALDEAGAEQRAGKLARAYDLLQEMGRCARDHDEARGKADVARADLAQATQDNAAFAARLAALREMQELQVAQNAEAARLGELADAAATPVVEDLRARLEEGGRCPVCGSLDHPFAHMEGAAKQLVDALRARREEARCALAQTSAEIVGASEGEAKNRALLEDAARRLAATEKTLARAGQEYAALLAQEPHPDAPASIADAGPLIDALIQRATSAREETAQRLTAARRLRDEIERLRKTRDGIGAAMEARRREREAANTALQVAGEERARLLATIDNDRERIESLDRSLAPFLTLCDLESADLGRDAEGARARLKQAGERFTQAARSLTALEESRAALALRAAKLESEAAGADQRASELREALGARSSDLARLRDERAMLLGGEATQAHRARFEERLKAVRAAHEQAREGLAAAGRTRAAAAERSAGAARERAGAEAALATAREAFAKALADAGLDEATAAPLLDVSAEAAATIRAAVETAQTRLSEARAAVDARRRDVDEAGVAAPDEAPREALALRVAELAGEIDGLSGRLGAIQLRLAQDDEARGRAAALSGEIEAARATRRLWDEISEAIGSANGDKFRRYAQSVTLEQLVALANQRLALLSPRYGLERAGEMGSLGLQIVDRDLGDERRSTRSLSGGERFLASLALALALAGLEGRDSFVDTLFIDEGFGALDSATLDVAIDALENLQGQGRKVGVISHVESMQQRIATKVCVERRGGGVCVVRLRAPGFEG